MNMQVEEYVKAHPNTHTQNNGESERVTASSPPIIPPIGGPTPLVRMEVMVPTSTIIPSRPTTGRHGSDEGTPTQVKQRTVGVTLRANPELDGWATTSDLSVPNTPVGYFTLTLQLHQTESRTTYTTVCSYGQRRNTTTSPNNKYETVLTLHFRVDIDYSIVPPDYELMKAQNDEVIEWNRLSQEQKDHWFSTSREAAEARRQEHIRLQLEEDFLNQSKGGAKTPSKSPVRPYTPPTYVTNLKTAYHYWAPLIGKKPPTKAEFIKAVMKIPGWEKAEIDWTATSVEEIGLIKLKITSDKEAAWLADNQKYIRDEFVMITPPTHTMSRINVTIIRRLAPLVVSQVKADTHPAQITNYIYACGPDTEPQNTGKVTNVQRMDNMVSFEARVWNPPKRNQVLREPKVQGFIKVFPAYPPPGEFDDTALIIHKKGLPAETEEVEDLAWNKLDVNPKPACIAQMYDVTTDRYLQSWFLGFDEVEAADYFMEMAKPKLTIMNFPGGNYTISRCKGAAPPKAEKPKQKRNETGGRGRGRSVRARGRK